jgi:4-hydroxy-3-polyprenylbenzoate decarboxylase
MENMKERLIIGVSGASGMPLAIEILRQLKNQEQIETHLIYSRAAEITLREECDVTIEELCQIADVVYDNQNIGAAPASGSFRAKGMIIVPCSMKTVAGIATGYSDSLLLRAADVMIKEKRKLVLAVRECPFSSIHLRNMYDLSMMGAVILPLVMSFYNQPQNLSDCVCHIAGKILDQFEIEGANFRRWEGLSGE